MLVKSLVAIALAALSLSPAAIAGPTGKLRRTRKCAAKPAGLSGGGAVNVAPAPPAPAPPKPSGCFPSAGFDTPDSPTKFAVKDWWCPIENEYAFMGFSYGVNGCPSKSSMTSSFKQMKNSYGARYVRMYATCDRAGFYDDIVDAAYEAGLGIYALVWFGFDGSDAYKGRLNKLLDTVKSNKRAPYVIRTLTIGSEAMYDNAISPNNLVSTINSVKGQVSKYGIQVSTSDMANEYNQHGNVLSAVDHVELNVLPFFSGAATTGSRANPLSEVNSVGKSKKIFVTQTGWPSNQNVWKANSRGAVASTSSEKQYFDLLDDMCATFKKGPHGGIGWFAHIWEDDDLPGWGIVHGGKAKFDFNARTKC